MILLVILAILAGMSLVIFLGWKILSGIERVLKRPPSPPPVIGNACQKTDANQTAPVTDKLIPIAIAWLVGAFVYFASVLDGAESLMFQPIIAATVSSVCVSLAFGAGLLLRVSSLGKFWISTGWWCYGLVTVSLLVLMFGASLGISHVYTNPETQQQVTGLHPVAGIPAYCALLFAITNWPFERSNDA